MAVAEQRGSSGGPRATTGACAGARGLIGALLRAVAGGTGRVSPDRRSPAGPLAGGPLGRRLAALFAAAVPRNRSGNNASVR